MVKIPRQIEPAFFRRALKLVPNDSEMLNSILMELDGWEEVLRDVDLSEFDGAPEL